MFRFDKQTVWTGKVGGRNIKDLPELTIWGVFFKGTFWRRVRNAWKYIIRGDYTENVDISLFGDEAICKIHDFARECIEMLESDSGGYKLKGADLHESSLSMHGKTITREWISGQVKKHIIQGKNQDKESYRMSVFQWCAIIEEILRKIGGVTIIEPKTEEG